MNRRQLFGLVAAAILSPKRTIAPAVLNPDSLHLRIIAGTRAGQTFRVKAVRGNAFEVEPCPYTVEPPIRIRRVCSWKFPSMLAERDAMVFVLGGGA